MAYIYEYIRTRGFEPMHFEEHYKRLEELANSLFSNDTNLDNEVLRNRIAEALLNNGYSSNTTNAVCLIYHDNGSIEVEPIDHLYNTFSLRALRPQGFIVQVSGELIVQNTSAKMALLELNHATAQIADMGVPIWVNDSGEVIAIDGSPVVAVFDNEIRFSQSGEGVEFELAYSATKSIKRTVTKGAIMVEDLSLSKELLTIDYRGITAIASYGKHLYMDVTAERIAKQIASIEE
uniref:hypothetical protein n=1 Tax=Alistipes sp. TaxID=1872444 RepID=UPI004055A273